MEKSQTELCCSCESNDRNCLNRTSRLAAEAKSGSLQITHFGIITICIRFISLLGITFASGKYLIFGSFYAFYDLCFLDFLCFLFFRSINAYGFGADS